MAHYRLLLASGAALVCLGGLTACEDRTEQTGDEPPVTNQQAGDARAPSSPAPSPDAPVLTPEAERGETGARAVLLDWARALERGDYNRAHAQFGDGGAASGMSREDHARQWSQFRRITISAPGGTMEGAAGSSYYRAPVTVEARRADGTVVRREGEVTLRRVNDVPGATPAQLRWHIISSELLPA